MTRRVTDNGVTDSLPLPASPKTHARSLRELQRELRRHRRHHGPEVQLDLAPLPSRDACRQGPRPCPHLRCRHHLGVDVNATGALRVFPGWEERPTCVLDVAGDGPRSLEQVSNAFAMTRERVRQVEEKALPRLRAALEAQGLTENDVRQALSEATGKQSPEWHPTTEAHQARQAPPEGTGAMPTKMTDEQWQKKVDAVGPVLLRGGTYAECNDAARKARVFVSAFHVKRIRDELGLPPPRKGRREAAIAANSRPAAPPPPAPRPAEPPPQPAPPQPPPRPLPAPVPAPPPAPRPPPTDLKQALAPLVAHLRATGLARLTLDSSGKYMFEGEV